MAHVNHEDQPPARSRSWFGWGWSDEALTAAQVDDLGALVAGRIGAAPSRTPPPSVGEIVLRPDRIGPLPAALAEFCSSAPLDRAAHTYGKAFRDVARAYARRWENPPDVVARPRSEQEVIDILEWASSEDVAVVPYGGGSSVVGGVEADLSQTPAPDRRVVSLDLARLSGVLEIDEVSRAASIAAGTFGPDADAALKPAGLTMRHFPQSYEHSTVGGWVATRSGGHFATGPTHIDDHVESIRCVTPAGIVESRRLPASGAGPSPDRLFLGSEGILGVITQVWLRVHRRPTFRASASVRFASLEAGASAARAIVQSGLQPHGCRLLDPVEAVSAGVTDGSAVLLLAFESADHPMDALLDRAVQIAADHAGAARPARAESDAAGWRSAFLRAPYLRDAMVSLNCIAETFETACTWADFPAFDQAVRSRVQSALDEVCGGGQVGMRFTHVYPDGPAPYYTVLAPGRAITPDDPLSLVAQWDEIKAAASQAISDAGGTITHHHAVGRVHRPWYDRQRPDVFAAALRAAKWALDPVGVLNPGVLV